MISCRNCWPWTKPNYITMTWRQSNNQWSGSISGSPCPKKFRVQKSAGKVLASIFFGNKMASSSLIIFQKTKLSMLSITHHCWCSLRTLWRKNAVGRSPRRSCSCMTKPWLTGYLQLRRNWLAWASSVLITHPILRIWPCRTTTCSPDWKNNLRSPFLSDVEVIAAVETWLDGQPSEFLFEWLAKVRATG